MKFAYATGSKPLDGFTIKRGIGVGGFGEVYFATTDAGKEVALKRVQRNLDVELRGVSTCLNLKHPHLVALYDIKYDDQGQAWVVMEYVDGESLKDVIDRNPNGLPEEDVRAWFTGIAAGVAYLHDHGIVHRDLKPGNLFLDEGIVKVGDYGLSKFISCSRRSGQTESVGTFHYMAPEIGNGNYGREIDIYALGIVLFELLTGRVPFDGESSQEIIMKHLTTEPDVRGLPQPYGAVVAKAMTKAPEKRFRDVGEMLTALGWSAEYGKSMHRVAPSEAPVLAAVTTAPEIFEINDDPPAATAEPLFIGDEPPAPLVVTPGIEFGEIKQQPPVIGGVRRQPRAGATPLAAGRPLAGRPQAAVASSALAATPGYVAPREPIATALGQGATSVGAWWHDTQLGTPMKVALLLGLGVVLVINASWLAPLAIGAGILYAVYYGIWALVNAWSNPGDAAHEPQLVGGARANHFRRVRWQDTAREMLRRRSPSEKIAELTGSLLTAALTSAVLAVVMLVIGGVPLHSTADTYAFFAWFALTCTLGSWFVLASGKLMEGKSEEPIKRRFTLLILGLALGAAAFGVQELLMVRLADPMDFPHITSSAQAAGAYDSQGLPLLPAYLAYFAGLFVVLRWWKQVDPLRSTRLSIWTTGVCVLWASVLEMFWHFPQPWGLMLAASISLTAQLAAPWLTAKERQQLRQQAGIVPTSH